MNAHPEALDELCARFDALERRVVELERRERMSEAATVAEPGERSGVVAASAGRALAEPAAQDAGVLTVAGRALLGIAGAYVLRAIAGAGVLPRPLLACAAALYAGVWLVMASRAASRRLASVLYAATSLLILAPMLWEMCLRFEALPAWAAAGLLAAYVAAATGLGYRRDCPAVLSLGYAGSAVTALALLIATHHMGYFAAILLCMVAVVEFGRRPAGTARAVVTLAADAGVWILLYIYRMPAEARPEYPALSGAVVAGMALALFGMEAASVAAGAMRRGQPVSLFAVAQTMFTFGLALCGVGWLLPGGGTYAPGGLCLALAGGCLVAAFGPLRRSGTARNFHIFAVWGSMLTVAGVFLVTTVAWAGVALGAAGVAAVMLADRVRSRAMELQGVTLLTIAAFASGLLVYAFRAVAGQMPGAPAWGAVAVAACAVLAYAASDEKAGEAEERQALHLVPGLLAACALAAFLVRGLFALAGTMITPDVFHVALLRTISLCGMALALAYGGARLGRKQLTRVAYATTVLVAAKLVFEDLRHGHMEFIAASIGLVAMTLMLVPRLAESGRRG